MSQDLRIQINKDLPLRSRRLDNEEVRKVFGMGSPVQEGERCEVLNCQAQCDDGLSCQLVESPTIDTFLVAGHAIAPTGFTQFLASVGVKPTCQPFTNRR